MSRLFSNSSLPQLTKDLVRLSSLSHSHLCGNRVGSLKIASSLCHPELVRGGPFLENCWSLSHSLLGRTLPDVMMCVVNFQFRYLHFFGKKEKLCTASFLNGSQLLLDGAIEIYHILIFFLLSSSF